MLTQHPTSALLLVYTGTAIQYAGTQAAILVPDIPACGSVVHIVDSLLLPPPARAPSFQPSPDDILTALTIMGAPHCAHDFWRCLHLLRIVKN